VGTATPSTGLTDREDLVARELESFEPMLDERSNDRTAAGDRSAIAEATSATTTQDPIVGSLRIQVAMDCGKWDELLSRLAAE